MDLSDAILTQLVVHKVGNKSKDEGIIPSQELMDINQDGLEEVLLKYFLNPFSNEPFFRFHHETDLNLNEVYTYVKKVFQDRSNFYPQSVNILKHLYNHSAHPNIKSGEFYLAYFSNCIFEDKAVDAVGIFKSENKDTFLKIAQKQKKFVVNSEEGVNIKRLDKGCLIFNVLEDYGYRLCIVDKTNKNIEAQYWKDEFLQVQEYQDQNFYTKSYLNMCTEFCQNRQEDQQAYPDKKEQAIFLNNTLDYFASKDEFNFQEFTREVLKEPEIIEEFNTFKLGYEVVNEIESKDRFDISKAALKKVKRKIRNLIRLDTDIEIKINHSVDSKEGAEFIERGYDAAKQMYYYKVYFHTEE